MSLTVTVCVLIVTFPDPSVAVQVTVVTPIGYVAGALLINVTVVQLSVATGAVNETVAVHPAPAVAVIATGVVTFGAVVSTTVTNCVAIAVLPLASVTVQVTVVAPNGNVTGASLATVATEQLSEVTGVPNANPVTPHVALDETVRADGATIVGFEASVIVTNCVAVSVLPLASLTVQVTVVTPIGNVVGALFVTLNTEQLSAVTGVPKETFKAKQPLLVVVVTANGAVIVGIVVSLTVTVVTRLVAEHPFASIILTE